MIRFSHSNKDTKDEEEKRGWAGVRQPLYSARHVHHHASPQESIVLERATTGRTSQV